MTNREAERTTDTLHDNKVPGLVLYVGAKCKTFYLYRRVDGQPRRIKLGRFPALTVEAARKKALGVNAEIEGGTFGKPTTFGELWKLYREEKRTKRTLDGDEFNYDKHLKQWAGRLISSITVGDCRRLHSNMSDTPFMANRVRALLSTMFNIAVEHGLCKDNPVRGVKKYPEQSRERFLTTEELPKFFTAGRMVASASADKTVRIWDPENGDQLVVLRGHNAPVRCVVFSADGKSIVSISDDRIVKTWEAPKAARTNDVFHEMEHLDVTSLAFSPDGKRFALNIWPSNHELKICDTATGHQVISIDLRAQNPTSLAFSPDGKRILCGVASHSKISRTATGIQEATPAGLTSWDANTGRPALTLSQEDGLQCAVACSPNGNFVASGCRHLNLWDAKTGERVWTVTPPCQNIPHGLAFSPDGKLLAAAFSNGHVVVCDSLAGRDRLVLDRGRASSSNFAFSPDGKRLAFGADNTVRLADALNGQILLELKSHSGTVTCVAFSPDGKRVISGSSDGSVKLWDAFAGQELLTLSYTKSVACAAFSPDGKYIRLQPSLRASVACVNCLQ